MRDYLRIALFFSTTLMPLTVSSAVYKYIDEDGRIAYGDKPVVGAERVDIRPSPELAEETEEATVSDDNFDEYGEVTKYSALQILNPAHNASINDRSGTVQLIFLPIPRLSENHQLVINIDGKDISRGKHTNLNLSQVSRGSHTVRGRIIDADGNLMIESAAITFHVTKSGQDDDFL